MSTLSGSSGTLTGVQGRVNRSSHSRPVSSNPLIQGAGEQVAQFLCFQAAGRAWGRVGRGVALAGSSGGARRHVSGPVGGGDGSQQEQSQSWRFISV